MDNRRIFDFLHARLAAGEDCVLVTVASVEGSSMRDPGAHMAVAADGAFSGSLSGGCIENAVVAEAQAALTAGAPRMVRFGAGSPYLDIRLPCGGGLDVHFLPLRDAALVDQCRSAIAARQPFSLSLPLDEGAAQVEATWQPTELRQEERRLIAGHWPVPKLMIIGHGAAPLALSRFARPMDIDISILTPDVRLVGAAKADGLACRLLTNTRQTDEVIGDPWTAFVFLFHDHDWEGALMQAALVQPHFYVGAMGGRRAHAQRREILAGLGIAGTAIDGIRAPIGLFHSSRDPETLALSVLAEVVQTYHDADFSKQAR